LRAAGGEGVDERFTNAGGATLQRVSLQQGRQELAGDWEKTYCNNNDFGVHDPFMRVLRPGKVPPEKVQSGSVRSGVENAGCPWDGIEPAVEDLGHDGDWHGGDVSLLFNPEAVRTCDFVSSIWGRVKG